MYTVDVQLTLDQCRAVKIKPAEGRVEALSDIESFTEHLDTLKGYSSIAYGLYGELLFSYLPSVCVRVVWNVLLVFSHLRSLLCDLHQL